MRSIILVLISLGVLCNGTQAWADSPSFTYLELEYIAAGDFDVSDGTRSVSLDMDGFALGGSVELGILLLQASRFELESDTVFNSRLEDSISTLAVGLTFELPRTALYALIRGRNDELSLRGGGFGEDVDGTSVGGEIGARINLTDRFEVNANIGKPSSDAGESFGVGVQFLVTENIGITLDFSSIEVSDDDLNASFDTTSIGLRYNF